MFENIDFSKMGEMLQKAQEEAKKMEENSKNKEFTAKSGGGLVKVTANGAGEIIDLEIDDSLLEDKESMQILLISAINDVLKMVEEDKKLVASQMLGSLGGFGG
ncbi:MAG: YbaB/EbfC family nucleoid-associated protein [Epsilonproteobacteria bacterium]|nr:YbaB/EbfC family nucleoid-associated protein [Campylobacterota bacterium]